MLGRGVIAQAGSRRGRVLIGLWIVLAAVGLAVLAADPARAAEGDLTFDSCLGSSSGCTFVPGTVLNDTSSLAVSPNGRSVYAATHPAYSPSGSVVQYGALVHLVADASGRLSYQGCLSDDGSSGACTVLSGNPLFNVYDVVVSPNGSSVYTAAPGYTGSYGGVAHFFADPTGGQLSYDGCISDAGSSGACLDATGTKTLYSVTQVAVSPNNGSVYAAADIPNLGGIAHLFADRTQGQLSWDGCVSDDGDGGWCLDVPGSGNPINGSSGVAVSPNGASVYLIGQGQISHLTANPDGGQLSWEGCVSDDGSGGSCADAPGGGTPFSEADSVVVSPDGTSVYVAAYTGGISHLSADSTGRLTWRECASADGTSGTCTTIPPRYAALSGPESLAISPDGHTLYVAAFDGDSVSWFSLDGQGNMTFQGCMSDLPVSGCTDPPGNSLDGADAVAVSPDGKSVYVGTVSGTVVRLAREQAAAATSTGGSGGGGGGSGGGDTTFTRSVTLARRRVTLTGTWPAACVASSASLSARLAAVSLGGRARFTGASLYLDRGVRVVRHRTVKRNGHRHRVRVVTYRPELTVHALPAGSTLPLARLGSGAHQLRVTVRYRVATRRHGHVVSATVSRTLKLPFKVC